MSVAGIIWLILGFVFYFVLHAVAILGQFGELNAAEECPDPKRLLGIARKYALYGRIHPLKRALRVAIAYSLFTPHSNTYRVMQLLLPNLFLRNPATPLPLRARLVRNRIPVT